MSSFSDDLRSVLLSACDSIERGARVIERRANESWNSAKINGQIRQIKIKIDCIYGEIGRISFENRDDPDKARDAIEKRLDEIEKLRREINELRRTARDSGYSAQCPNPSCNYNCYQDDTFCRGCGTKL